MSTPRKTNNHPQLPSWGPLGADFVETGVMGDQAFTTQPTPSQFRLGFFIDDRKTQFVGFIERDQRRALAGHYIAIRQRGVDPDVAKISRKVRPRIAQFGGGLAVFEAEKTLRFGLMIPKRSVSEAFDTMADTKYAHEQDLIHQAVGHAILFRLPQADRVMRKLGVSLQEAVPDPIAASATASPAVLQLVIGGAQPEPEMWGTIRPPAERLRAGGRQHHRSGPPLGPVA